MSWTSQGTAPDGPSGFFKRISKHRCLHMAYYQIEFVVLIENKSGWMFWICRNTITERICLYKVRLGVYVSCILISDICQWGKIFSVFLSEPRRQLLSLLQFADECSPVCCQTWWSCLWMQSCMRWYDFSAHLTVASLGSWTGSSGKLGYVTKKFLFFLILQTETVHAGTAILFWGVRPWWLWDHSTSLKHRCKIWHCSGVVA